MSKAEDTFPFCPMCQLPLKAIAISPDLHVSQCISSIEDDSREECPRGVHCLSTDLFHYRDFSHRLLAAYRSSADFVSPDVDIQPSPKKRKIIPTRSPRKQKKPLKVDLIRKITVSGSDSDSDSLIPLNKLSKQLNFNEKTSSETKSVQNSSAQTKKKLSHEKPNIKFKTTTNNNKGCFETDNCGFPCNKSTTNLEFKSIEECYQTKSGQSNSIKISTNHYQTTKNNNHDKEKSSHNPIPRSPLGGVSLETTRCSVSELESTELNVNDSTKFEIAPNIMSKSPVCLLKKLELSKFASGSLTIRNKSLLEVNKSNNRLKTTYNFDDSVPCSRQLLPCTKKSTSKSPSSTTLHTCTTDYNGLTKTTSESVISSDVEEHDEGKGYESSNSSEVVIPHQILKKVNLFLSSSSDSDLPLASLVDNNNKASNILNKKNAIINSNIKTKRVLRTSRKKLVNTNHQISSESEVNINSSNDSDSGKSTELKNSSISNNVQGKEIAGKILRTPKKVLDYINSKSEKTKSNNEINGFSDKDSDSGKSTGTKESTFIPSEVNMSSQYTDSAFSAESSDNLVSSSSTTFTSSENNSCDYQLSDPPFTGESDNSGCESNMKISKGHRRSRKYSSKTSSICSNSSDISQKEKLLFGGNKKSSPLINETKYLPTKPIEKIYNTSQNEAKKEWQAVLLKMRNSCFPSDLKVHSEDSLTAVSSCSSSDTSRSSVTLPSKQCPFYKRIPDTPFAVDAFQYWNIPGVKVYFLSHFHSDHYIGLKKSFAKPIYCSQITANLVRMQLRVEEKWLRIVELNEPQVVCGVEVTPLDANHCPGSMMFLFSLTNGQNYLHVGDFRASNSMMAYPSLQRISISKLFLDTTYCSPQYCFPRQEEVISKVIDIVKEQVKTKPQTLVVCGSYTIGKEKVFLGIAEALDWRVWASPNKQRVFTCLNNSQISSRLSRDPFTANVHVLPMANIQITPLRQHLESCAGVFTHVLGFKPTGWELNGKTQDFKITVRDNITIYGVPYSEHSSFAELRDFVRFLEPREIVPTVNVGSAASRAKMSKYFSEWLRPQSSETQPTKAQTKVSQYFTKSS